MWFYSWRRQPRSWFLVVTLFLTIETFEKICLWVFLAICRPSPAAQSGGWSSPVVGCRSLIVVASLVAGHGLESSDSVDMVSELSSLEACGSFLDQGLSLCPLHWQVDSSLPLSHQGSPWDTIFVENPFGPLYLLTPESAWPDNWKPSHSSSPPVCTKTLMP